MEVTQAQIRAELAKRELARRFYLDYLRYVYDKQWKDTAFSCYLAKKIQSFIETETDNAYDILVIATPPQHGKSHTITEALPSWYLGKWPDKRVIEVSYNQDTAMAFGRKNREKVEQFGGNLFGVTLGTVCRNDEFNLAGHTGQMLSRGILSGITSNPADLFIIDDPIKSREEADSQTIREKHWGEWLSSIKTRLQAHAKIIIIMTPWHEDDLRARVLQNEKNAEYIRLPVEAEENDVLGRAVGDALCPELGKGNKWLEQFKTSYLNDPKGGARAWNALYMCNPVVEGGNVVKRTWWKFYRPEDIPQFATEMISVDATFKSNADKDNDYVAIEVWGKLDGNYYLRYVFNQRADFPQTLQAILMIRQLYPNAHTLLIEDKANGSAIIQTLQKSIPGVIAVNPQGGKVARVNAVSPAIESGHVFLPEGAPWLEDFLRQFSEFPAGKHDDMVDAATQCLHRMIYSSGILDMPPQLDSAQRLALKEQEAFLSDALWEPYDNGGEFGSDTLMLDEPSDCYGGYVL